MKNKQIDHIMRIFKPRPGFHTFGIRAKVTLVICLALACTIIIGVGLGYFLGFKLLTKSLGEKNHKICRILAEHLSQSLNEKMFSAQKYSVNPFRVKIVENSNTKFFAMAEPQKKQYFEEIDELWKGSVKSGLEKYLGAPGAIQLREIAKTDPAIASIHLTDKYGNFVIGSEKTQSFNESNYKWWQGAYAGGRGNNYIGKIEFNKERKLWFVPIAIPLKNEKGEVVGICETDLDPSKYFGNLENFFSDKKGDIFLFDGSGNLIYGKGKEPLSVNFGDEEKWHKLISNQDGLEEISIPALRDSKMMAFSARIESPILLKEGFVWYIMLGQDTREELRPLLSLAIQMMVILSISFFIMLIEGYLAGGLIAGPINILYKGVEHISKGDWDYKIVLNTKDEIQEFAESFNKMIAEIREKQRKLAEEITVRAQAENIALINEENYKTLVDNLPQKIFLKDKNLFYISANRNFANDLYTTPEKLIGKTDNDFLPKDVAQVYQANEYAIMGKGETVELDEKYYERGREINVHSIKVPIKESDGKVMGLLGIFWDITKQKEQEEELGKYRENLEAMVKGRTSELKKVNEATLNILEDLEATKDELELQMWGLQKANDGIRLLYRELDNKNAALLKLDQLKSDFVASVSHELRTPLTIIRESVSLLLDGILGSISEKQRQIMSICLTDIDRLGRIINDLLDISKIEAGKVRLSRSVVDIIGLTKEVCNNFEMNIKSRGLELRQNLPEKSIEIYADRDKIIQVLTNLLGNSVKFTSKGYIEVTVEDKGDSVVCSLKDTGRGISKEDLSKVFSKFQQFGRVDGPGEKGTGLGLSIAKGIIDLHQGEISVESKEHEGTQFTFTLPKYSPELELKDKIEKDINEAVREDKEVSLFIIKVQNYDKIMGSPNKGRLEDILNKIPVIVHGTVKGEDFVNRQGDEIIILSKMNKGNSAKINMRLRKAVSDFVLQSDKTHELGVIYGSATYPSDAEDSISLIDKVRNSFIYETEEENN